MSDMWNISNILSLFRALLLIPLVFTLCYDLSSLTVLIGIIAFISDFLDGYLARKFNHITEFGKIIDPVADKLLVGGVALVLIIQGKLAVWIGIAILLRDILILSGGLYARKKLKFVIPSNYTGKITVDIIGILLLGTILNISYIMEYGKYAALIAMIVSLVVYGNNLIRKLGAGK